MGKVFKVENISQLTEFLGQEPLKHPLISIVDFSKVDFDSLGDLNDLQFISTFYSIVLKQLKSGSIKYGRQHLDFQNGSLFFTAPNQLTSVASPELSECEYNWGLFFHPDLILGTTLHQKLSGYTFLEYGADEALHLSEDEKQNLTEILNSLKKEIHLPIDKHTKNVLSSGLDLILNHCERYYDRQFITREESNKHIVTALKTYLNEYFSSDQPQKNGLPTVKQCAEQVHLSPNYLSDLLKKETGKSTQDLIHYHVLELAKNHLLNSDHSISEIAFLLGFKYSQYFGKLFKNKEGITPSEFRNMN